MLKIGVWIKIVIFYQDNLVTILTSNELVNYTQARTQAVYLSSDNPPPPPLPFYQQMHSR